MHWKSHHESCLLKEYVAELQGCVSIHDSERRGSVFDLRQGLRAVNRASLFWILSLSFVSCPGPMLSNTE